MAREWTNIDVLRMEKFLLLTRRYVGATFSLLEKAGWEEKVVETHLDMLEEIPLNVADGKLPNGMRYHVIDVFVDELERVGALEMEGTGANLDTLLRPLRRLGKESPTKTVRTRCKEALEDERLPTNKKTLQDAVTDEEWNGFED
jgi:ribosomal RNA-processing protein 1